MKVHALASSHVPDETLDLDRGSRRGRTTSHSRGRARMGDRPAPARRSDPARSAANFFEPAAHSSAISGWLDSLTTIGTSNGRERRIAMRMRSLALIVASAAAIFVPVASSAGSPMDSVDGGGGIVPAPDISAPSQFEVRALSGPLGEKPTGHITDRVTLEEIGGNENLAWRLGGWMPACDWQPTPRD